MIQVLKVQFSDKMSRRLVSEMVEMCASNSPGNDELMPVEKMHSGAIPSQYF